MGSSLKIQIVTFQIMLISSIAWAKEESTTTNHITSYITDIDKGSGNDYDYSLDYFWDSDSSWWDKSDEDLKSDFGCPETNWNLLKQNNLPVINSCIKNGYKVNYPPIDNGNLILYTTYSHIKVLKVDETQKTVTINIKQSTLWEDRRIFTSFSRNDNSFGIRNAIELTPLALHGTYPIWIPTWFLHIFDLKEWKSLFDPVFLSRLGFMADNPFNSNVTLVNASLEWKVTIFCEFNFDSFPFDTQKCPYRMRNLGSRRVTRLLFDPHGLHHYKKRYEASGFDVITKVVGNEYMTTGQNESLGKIGFDITMKRVIQPYLFQYFLPCMAIVAVSFISFLVPLTSIPGRIALVVTQFLTLTNIFIHQMVSYIIFSYLKENNRIIPLQMKNNKVLMIIFFQVHESIWL